MRGRAKTCPDATDKHYPETRNVAFTLLSAPGNPGIGQRKHFTDTNMAKSSAVKLGPLRKPPQNTRCPAKHLNGRRSYMRSFGASFRYPFLGNGPNGMGNKPNGLFNVMVCGTLLCGSIPIDCLHALRHTKFYARFTQWEGTPTHVWFHNEIEGNLLSQLKKRGANTHRKGGGTPCLHSNAIGQRMAKR
jgi:hypothetical protein